MICPSCPATPLALFICDDGVHRCYACKARRPVAVRPPIAPEASFKTTPGPKDGVPYVSPYGSAGRIRGRGRIAILNMIEAELRAKMKDIEARPGWRGIGASSAYFAYAQAIQIVRDHHVITADGVPMRGCA